MRGSSFKFTRWGVCIETRLIVLDGLFTLTHLHAGFLWGEIYTPFPLQYRLRGSACNGTFLGSLHQDKTDSSPHIDSHARIF